MHQLSTQPNTYTTLQETLSGLGRIASNFRWAWKQDARQLFTRLDSWRGDFSTNPVTLLATARNLGALAQDSGFVTDVKREAKELESYLDEPLKSFGSVTPDHPVAYYCAEYGLHESFAQYCGGLGILAGDHCKEASDMALPFIAIGCFYRLGFFRQSIEVDGRQSHVSVEFDPVYHSVERVLDPKTKQPLSAFIDFPGRTVKIAVWRAAVGRVPLLLLDTDLPENAPWDRPITAQLYMTTRSMRFHQEMVLGIGGTRVLEALGVTPSVFHMNEGHSALLLIERLRAAILQGKSWKEATAEVEASSVLTIHTPVPAGNERFDAKLVKTLLEPTLARSGIGIKDIMKMGLDSVHDPKVFDMTAFALRLSRAANGVSILHGHTADSTWRPVVKKPVGAVTNGVHMPTWLGPQMRSLYEKHGAHFESETRLDLTERPGKRATWEGVEQIPDEELWKAHVTQKHALVEFATERLLKQHTKYGEGPEQLLALSQALNPDAFLIGFARRMTGYKRPWLVLSDIKRVLKLLDNSDTPVQILFSGKAHYLDQEGQEVLRQIYQLSQDRRLKGKVFLLEEYDMAVGRALVQGVDLWINNPLRPLEASGTSGMKAAANGVPNASILDGWWDEGVEIHGANRNGFAVGSPVPQKSRKKQDRSDADELYRVLEEEVLPLYEDRNTQGVPTRWIKVMKRAIATSVWAFSTKRMITDYVEQMYDTSRTTATAVIGPETRELTGSKSS